MMNSYSGAKYLNVGCTQTITIGLTFLKFIFILTVFAINQLLNYEMNK